jgi:hypothetical protein
VQAVREVRVVFVAGGVFFESNVRTAVQGKRLEVRQVIDTAPNPDRMHKREFFSSGAVANNGSFLAGSLFEHIRSDPWLFENARKLEILQRINPVPGGNSKVFNGGFISELTGIFMRDWSLATAPVCRNQGFMPEFILLLFD